MELSKSQKKIVAILIKKGVKRECAGFLEDIKLFTGSSQEEEDPHQKYLELFKKVHAFDKHLSWRYDTLRGSDRFGVVIGLFKDDVLTVEDISLFEDEVQKKLLELKKETGESRVNG